MAKPGKSILNNALLRAAYEGGLFPMADGSGEGVEALSWYRPVKRAVITPDSLHIPRRLARFIRSCPFTIRWNDDFRTVMTECGKGREETWINAAMIDAYTAWHEAGEAFCLSVFNGDQRVGGIYGVQMGGAFMAESMFSRMSNASSVGLVTLVAGLWRAGIEMIDLQYKNAHTEQFGLREIADVAYMRQIQRLKDKDVELKKDYFFLGAAISLTQSFNHTS